MGSDKNKETIIKKRLVVIQRGGRRGYSAATSFLELGNVDVLLITDFASTAIVNRRIPNTIQYESFIISFYIGKILRLLLFPNQFVKHVENYIFYLECLRKIRSFNPDFAYFVDGHGGKKLIEYSKQIGAYCIVEITNRIEYWNENDIFQGYLYKKWYEKIIKAADHIVVPSQVIHDEVSAKTDKFVSKVPFSCRIEPLICERERYETNANLCFVGNNWKRKGLQTVINCLDELKAIDSKVQLYIVGKVDPKIKLNDHSLHVKGICNFDEVRKVMLSSQIFVLPSLSEGTSAAALEAIYSGCIPIISRQVGVSLPREYEWLYCTDEKSIVGIFKKITELSETDRWALAQCVQNHVIMHHSPKFVASLKEKLLCAH